MKYYTVVVWGGGAEDGNREREGIEEKELDRQTVKLVRRKKKERRKSDP